VEVNPEKSDLPIKLLADRLIVKFIEPDDKFEGTNIYRNKAMHKEMIETGKIVSIGTKLPEGYEDLSLGLIVDFYRNAAIEIEYPEDKEGKYFMIRVGDALAIV
jgi:co-chaperonin GroES (HSP10)